MSLGARRREPEALRIPETWNCGGFELEPANFKV
jgi:hypothetical protein